MKSYFSTTKHECGETLVYAFDLRSNGEILVGSSPTARIVMF